MDRSMKVGCEAPSSLLRKLSVALPKTTLPSTFLISASCKKPRDRSTPTSTNGPAGAVLRENGLNRLNVLKDGNHFHLYLPGDVSTMYFAILNPPCSLWNKSQLVCPIRSLVSFRCLGETNVDKRHLTTGNRFEPALKRGAHFARFFDLFPVAVEGPRDRGIVRTRIN